MKTKYVLKNRRRFITFVVVSFFLLSSLFFTNIAYGDRVTGYKMIEVKAGDTLWDIAADYGQGSDVRECIYKIKKANGLQSSEIFEGDILKVPEK